MECQVLNKQLKKHMKIICQNQEKLLCVEQVSQKGPEVYFLKMTKYFYPYNTCLVFICLFGFGGFCLFWFSGGFFLHLCFLFGLVWFGFLVLFF